MGFSINNPKSGGGGGGTTVSFVDSIGSIGGVNLPNSKFIGINSRISATGNQDLYTCPSNRRAIILPQWWNYNDSSANSPAFAFQVKISGTYYTGFFGEATASSSGQTNNGTNEIFNAAGGPIYILEAGE